VIPVLVPRSAETAVTGAGTGRRLLTTSTTSRLRPGWFGRSATVINRSSISYVVRDEQGAQRRPRRDAHERSQSSVHPRVRLTGHRTVRYRTGHRHRQHRGEQVRLPRSRTVAVWMPSATPSTPIVTKPERAPPRLQTNAVPHGDARDGESFRGQ
jgi:hypothetical protein